MKEAYQASLRLGEQPEAAVVPEAAVTLEPLVHPSEGTQDLALPTLSALLGEVRLSGEPEEPKPEEGQYGEEGAVGPDPNLEGAVVQHARLEAGEEGANEEQARPVPPAKTPVPREIHVELELPPVIRHGNAGDSFPLVVNYVPVDLMEGRCLFEYIVTFEPDIEDLGQRVRMLNSLSNKLGVRMFNGLQMIVPSKYAEDNFTLTSGTTTVSVAYRGTTRVTSSIGILMCNRALMHVFRAIQLCPMKVGTDKYFYNPQASQVLEKHKLEVWPGYVFRVDNYEAGAFMQVDTCSKVVRTQTVLEVIKGFARKDIANYQELARKDLIGHNLITRYNNKTYKLDEIDFDLNPFETFTKNNTGEVVSYVEYYKSTYGLDITDTKQPLLMHMALRPGSKEPLKVVLIPELCYITGLNEQLRSNFQVMKDISDISRQMPKVRVNSIEKLLESIRTSPMAMDMLALWGIQLGDGLARLKGRRIDPEYLHFGDGYKERVSKSDWGRAATTKKVLDARAIDKWVVIYPKSADAVSKGFCQMLAQQAQRLGIQVERPRPIPLVNDRTEHYLTAIRELPESTSLVVTILGNNRKSDLYGAIKKLCCLERPVASQVILQKTISNERRLQAVAQKIALQINCKLGGSLWSTKLPVDGLMIVGVDIYKDKAVNKNMIAAVVSSLNENHTKFFSQVVFKEKVKDLYGGIGESIVEAALKFKSVNGGVAPRHIIVYRSGINCGLFDQAHQEAVKTREKMRAVPELEHTTITVTMVQTQVITKLFKVQGQDYVNPLPGTVLDHTVMRHDWYDFLIVPMESTMSTIKPTYFNVVLDTSSFTPDVLQRISYAMTFMYYNWPGNVKIPAHCQYAHKLVELVGEHLHAAPHQKLLDKLSYL